MPVPPDFVRHNVNLAPLNTLALPGYARFFARIEHMAQLQSLRAWRDYDKLPRFVLGGGSNLVLGGDFDGLVIQPALQGRTLDAEEHDAWYIRAAAGENWDALVRWTLANNWPGLENLIAIPGNAGAAPIQNIGAYGVEINEFIHTVETVNLNSGRTHLYKASDCRFAYRDSLFKQHGWHRDGSVLINAIVLRLPKTWHARAGYPDLAAALSAARVAVPSAHDIAHTIAAIRQNKLPDPAITANAGSFFKNPIIPTQQAERLRAHYPSLPVHSHSPGQCKLAAGWLIEHAGWKGRRLGPVGMDSRQALVLVNHGGATYADVRALSNAVQAAVYDRFGIVLIVEPVHVD